MMGVLHFYSFKCNQNFHDFFKIIFQVVRLKLKNDKRIVGTLIPASCMTSLLKVLSIGSEEAEETIY